MDYEALLTQAKEQLPEVSEAKSRYEVPKVKGHVQGNATIISNFVAIAEAMRRPLSHILKFLNRELGTKGVVKQQKFVIFNTKIPAARINEKVALYSEKYVICPTCKAPDTKIEKVGMAVNLQCSACGTKTPLR